MPSEILLRAVFLLLVDCATILFWFFLDHVKKRRRPHKKEIFICGDCWLLVFDFLAPSQLGVGIALINRRFDLRVDEHFKTRKSKLNKQFLIQWDIQENGTKKMKIVNSAGNPLPIPRNPLPNKVIGFQGLTIAYIDQNVIAFLRRFHRFFAVCSTVLYIRTENVRILDFVLLNIWPMFRHSMHLIFLNSIAFRRFRQLAPSLLNDCSSLHSVLFVTFCIHFWSSSPPDSVVPFDLINEVTGEKLILQQASIYFWLTRCPIAWDEQNWRNVADEMIVRQNPIDFVIEDGRYDDGFLDAASPGPSDQQQK